MFHAFARLGAFAHILACFIAAGCGGGDGLTRVPVSGSVSVGAQVLQGKTGSVLFKPDAAKGNSSTVDAEGVLDKDGKYTLRTKGLPGAPTGWYKVAVNASEPGADRSNPVRTIVPRKYVDVKTTPLTVEVVPDPKSYDLNLNP